MLTNIMDASMPAHPAHRMASPTMYSSMVNNSLTSWLPLYGQHSRPTLRQILTTRTTVCQEVNKRNKTDSLAYYYHCHYHSLGFL